MSSVPVVAIVGRPNVGKSLLFNQLIEQQRAAVHNIPGMTRDRIYGEMEWRGHTFQVIDTGGYEIRDQDPIKKHIREQVRIAIDQANVVFFVIDGRTPLTDLDHQITEMLRESGRPVFLLVNKCDNSKQDMEAVDFYELGLAPLFPVSALHRRGLTEVLDELVDNYSGKGETKKTEGVIKVAVSGRQNVGKSTFVNTLAGETRVIASDMPGTTRDSVDTLIKVAGHEYLLIDTAGIRRKSKISDQVEKLAVMSAMLSIHKADVVILMLDASGEIVSQDLRIAGLVEKAGKGIVIALNKWDLVNNKDVYARELREKMRREMYFWDTAPIVFLSALKGKNCHKMFSKVRDVYHHFTREIPTPELNRAIQQFLEEHPPPTHQGHAFKFYYGTQVRTAPPAFELFVNNREWIHATYQRYLKKCMKRHFGFEGVPIRLYFRGKKDTKRKKG